MKVSIVVPLLNENKLVCSCLSHLQSTLAELKHRKIGQWEVVISDAGSTDGTIELVNRYMSTEGWKFEKSQILSPSIGKTVRQGISQTSGDYLWILPVDTRLHINAFIGLWENVSGGRVEYGAFLKAYVPSTTTLKIYQDLQNSIRLKKFRHFVWTNGIFMSRKVLETYDVPTAGFMEDVIWSDQIRRKFQLLVLDYPVEVSSRRYNPNGVLRQIFINFAVITLFRMRLMNPQNLKTIYNG